MIQSGKAILLGKLKKQILTSQDSMIDQLQFYTESHGGHGLNLDFVNHAPSLFKKPQ